MDSRMSPWNHKEMECSQVLKQTKIRQRNLENRFSPSFISISSSCGRKWWAPTSCDFKSPLFKGAASLRLDPLGHNPKTLWEENKDFFFKGPILIQSAMDRGVLTLYKHDCFHCNHIFELRRNSNKKKGISWPARHRYPPGVFLFCKSKNKPYILFYNSTSSLNSCCLMFKWVSSILLLFRYWSNCLCMFVSLTQGFPISFTLWHTHGK